MCTIYGAFFKNWCNSPLKEKNMSLKQQVHFENKYMFILKKYIQLT
jgi:flagellar motor component MotA